MPPCTLYVEPATKLPPSLPSLFAYTETGFEIGSLLDWKGKNTARSNSSFHSNAGPMSHFPVAT